MKFLYDGTLEVTIRKEFSDSEGATTSIFTINKDRASLILDTSSMAGYTMRQSLVYAVYTYLVDNQLVAGEISVG